MRAAKGPLAALDDKRGQRPVKTLTAMPGVVTAKQRQPFNGGRVIARPLHALQQLFFQSGIDIRHPFAVRHKKLLFASHGAENAPRPPLVERPWLRSSVPADVAPAGRARFSTCRPYRPYHPCRDRQACWGLPSWAFRRWRIRWSASEQPRKRHAAERSGTPAWDR